jgi:hypothetical protein
LQNHGLRISSTRFAQKTRFDARQRDARPVSVRNFFIAKNCDSESAHGLFPAFGGAAANSVKHRTMNAQVAKSPVTQAFPATLMFARCEFSRIARPSAKTVRRADR